MFENRFKYHPPLTDGVKAYHELVRAKCFELAEFFSNLPGCREQSLAVTKVEEAMFWANAAIARNQ